MDRFGVRTTSFKFRMTGMVACFAFAASAGVAMIALGFAESGIRNMLGAQEVSMVASAAAYVDQDLDAKQQQLKAVTERLPLGDAPTPARLQALIEEHSSLRETFFNITVFDMSGKLVANLKDRRAVGTINVAARPFFRDTLRLREGVISAPFLSLLSNKPVVVVTEPINDRHGRLLYVIAGAIDLQRPSFAGQLDAMYNGTSAHLFIMNSEGVVIYHPDRSRILSRVDAGSRSWGPELSHALKASGGWSEGPSINGPALIASEKLHKTEWIIGAAYPVQEAFAPLLASRHKAMAASGVVAILAALLGWWLTWRMLRPLGQLRSHVAQITAGNANIEVFNVRTRDEFGQLSRAFYRLSMQRRAAEDDLLRMATTDALTGMHNRRMFDEILPQAVARAGRNRSNLALALLDVDYFKSINDTMGHAAGDAVLVEFARRLRSSVRLTDTVARLAGDEFVIIFEQVDDTGTVSQLGGKILEAMQAPFQVEGKALVVTASMGIAVKTRAAAAPLEILRAADQALYGVKAAGRNGFALNTVGQERVVAIEPSLDGQAA
ncbi:diguanylate cyclase [Massilia sp. MB5]|uniref:diguanylate cyclase domain-containing protein n=1 Tax=Massilia sp. MB5 TaxID=2919578 RepID=UPI001F0DEEE6|nr:diguanylate cyclase [Massilia sp. MB5]UMR28628.1 diguanylate cyclase [Massilia sp. MB5]